ncbi:hypothetical protein pb186bvf_020811 [Paramecium bursaria]
MLNLTCDHKPQSVKFMNYYRSYLPQIMLQICIQIQYDQKEILYYVFLEQFIKIRFSLQNPQDDSQQSGQKKALNLLKAHRARFTSEKWQIDQKQKEIDPIKSRRSKKSKKSQDFRKVTNVIQQVNSNKLFQLLQLVKIF